MKVTAIRAQKNKTDRFSIFVDDKYSFSFSESELIESKIYSGQEITKSLVTGFQKSSKLDKFYNQVLRLISNRPRSKKEIIDYLTRKQLDQVQIEIVVDKLDKHNLIDDQDFARRWIENRLLLKSASKRRLSQELRQKGIDIDIIDTALDQTVINDKKQLIELVEQKMSQPKFKNDKLKLMQFLARRGFNYGDIKEVLEQFN